MKLLSATLALAAAGCVAAAGVLVQDTPYTEVVAQKFTSSAQGAVAHWGTIPTATIISAQHVPSTGIVALTTDGLMVLKAGASAETSSWAPLPVAPALPATLPAASALAVGTDGSLQAVVTPSTVHFLSCGASTCASKALAADFQGGVTVATCLGGTGAAPAPCASLWVGSTTGLWRISTATGTLDRVSWAGQLSAAADPSGTAVFSGNTEHVMHWAGESGALVRREWVTNVTSGAGGVYDGPATGMAFGPDGTLFVTTATALNVRYPNRTVVRVAGLQGLIMGNLTSVAVGTAQAVDEASAALVGGGGVGTCQLVLGSTQGAATVQLGACGSNPGTWSNWRYFNGPRYLPTRSPARGALGNVVTGVAGGVWAQGASAWAAAPLIVTNGGVVALAPQTWTLGQKAAAMEVTQSRHDRHGMTSDCTLLQFGNYTSCTNHASDNNGLWTSLVVAAESFRFALTADPDAGAEAGRYLQGMHLLNAVTGVEGLMARSAIAPGVPTPQGGTWHNSSAPGLQGWQWKGDTSSDEVTGHTFVYPIAASLLGDMVLPPAPWTPGTPGGAAADTALTLLHTIVSYIADNNMTLVDVTGLPTHWGHWDPPTLNDQRSWSDGRGVNSLQALAFLQAAGATATPSAPWASSVRATYDNLVSTSNGHDYGGNVVNAKIEAPSDDNYSDDELTFLPFYLFSVCSAAMGEGAADPSDVQAGLRRTFDFVRPWRSNLWGAVWLASGGAAWPKGSPAAASLASVCSALSSGNNATATGAGAASSTATDDAVTRQRLRHRSVTAQGAAAAPDTTYSAEVSNDIAWNLRTWPLELIDWPVDNSNRLDLFFRANANRFGVSHTDSVRVLPAYERVQFRWNGNPHGLDGGSGVNECDAGAWLLPYWMARYHGILGAAAGQ